MIDKVLRTLVQKVKGCSFSPHVVYLLENPWDMWSSRRIITVWLKCVDSRGSTQT